jgi:heavy metal translocating P-type ATPase
MRSSAGPFKSATGGGGKIFRFCCPGCRQVFLILFASPEGMPTNFRETELYKACVESGIIPGEQEDVCSREAPQDSPFRESSPPPLPLTLKVEGMWCPACSWLIEEVLRRTKGILEPQVFFLSDLVHVQYFPHILSPREIMARISRLGYRPSLFQEGLAIEREKKDLQLRLGVSSILAMNVMMISLALYAGFFRDLSQTVIGYFSYPLWLMTTPVIFYGGFPILRRAFAGLRYGQTSMDTLISVGALAAYSYSLVQMSRGSLHLYFDTASMLITLVLLGKYIETHARVKVSAGITDLYKLANQKVRIITPTPTLPPQPLITSPPLAGGVWGEGEKERWIRADAAKPGDDFLVMAGERVPLDGQVVSGRGDMDQSIFTGEALPVRKGPGDDIMGGVLLLEGNLKLKVTRVGPDSTLGQMITLMQEALSKKNPVELLADRITRWFVPCIFVVACAVALFLWRSNSSVDEALMRSLTVLIISCPCALGIAIPLVKVAAMGLGRAKGILIRNPGALEQAKDLDTIVFDKTGTLTEGNFRLREIIAEGISEQEILGRLGAVEVFSGHFLAKEIVRKARGKSVKMEEATDFKELEGMGVKGSVQGAEVFIGNRRLTNNFGLGLSSSLEKRAFSAESRGMTVVFFGWEGQVRGLLVFGDSLKRGVPELVRKLQARKIITWLVSGDAPETTRTVAEDSGMDEFRGQALPQDKVELIKSLQQKGRRVGMVGDGINDAAALAQSDVGVALGTGTNIILEASDFTLLAGEPTRILQILDLSALAAKTVRQNLFLALFYNGLAIPLAVAGFLNPLIAVFAMFASSLTVIGNTLKISRNKTL